MKVLKSDGSLQDFEIEKIGLGMSRASDECDESMTAGDMHVLSKYILESIPEGEHVISSSDLKKLVERVLEENGFHDVAQKYRDGKC